MTRRRPLIAAAILLGVVASAGGTPAEAAAIRAIRPTTDVDSTRIIIEVTETTPYKWGMVPADRHGGLPPRFYVDIDGVRIDPRQKLDFTMTDPRVRQVRAGQNAQGRARVVMDLNGPVVPTVFALQSPARIVVDLKGTGGPIPTAPTQSIQVAKPAAPPTPPKGASPSNAPLAPPRVAEGPLIVTGRPGATTLRPAAVAVPRARRVRIVIDPGHGGKDPGARGAYGVVEKDLTLDISRRLARKLKDRLGFDVTLTRQSDEYVSLGRRKDVANRLEADLFVSIHANAAKNRRARGIETYYLKNTNDRATLRLAHLENGVESLIGGDVSTDADLSYILSDIIQGQKEADSIRAARHLQKSLVGEIKPRYADVDDLGVKQGPFLVLDGTYMAAVLVEVGFLSNSVEAKRMASANYREALADGLFAGIARYFEDDRTALLR
jgi:N-acetylmuramoyl-L-alanine amidase